MIWIKLCYTCWTKIRCRNVMKLFCTTYPPYRSIKYVSRCTIVCRSMPSACQTWSQGSGERFWQFVLATDRATINDGKRCEQFCLVAVGILMRCTIHSSSLLLVSCARITFELFLISFRSVFVLSVTCCSILYGLKTAEQIVRDT